MRVLVADDDVVSRRLTVRLLERWGYSVVEAGDGEEAWARYEAQPSIQMAILDWMMPKLDGVDLCRRLRVDGAERPLYVLLCTSRDGMDDLIEGLDAGADDYLVKPLRADELHARLRVGQRTLDLQQALRDRIGELDEALAEVKQLRGMIPICMHCKRMRSTDDVWQRLETYLEERADVVFSHGLCEACLKERYPDAKEKTGT